MGDNVSQMLEAFYNGYSSGNIFDTSDSDKRSKTIAAPVVDPLPYKPDISQVVASSTAGYGYDEATFINPKKRNISLWQLELIESHFGKHALPDFMQVGISRGGRDTFWFKDKQAIQLDTSVSLGLPAFTKDPNGADPTKDVPTDSQLYGRGRNETYYFRTAQVTSRHVRAMLDVSEQPYIDKNGRIRFHPADLTTMHAIGGSERFDYNMKAALLAESQRRAGVVNSSVLEFQRQAITLRTTAIEAGKVQADGKEDKIFQDHLKTIEKIAEVLVSGKLTSRQMSAAYRLVEPWGASQPLPMLSPDKWNKLEEIVGLRRPQPKPAIKPAVAPVAQAKPPAQQPAG